MIQATKISGVTLGVAVLSWMLFSISVLAEPNIDEKSQELLEKMSASIKEAQNLSVEIVTDINIEIGGLKQNMSQGQSVAISRPNRFALRSDQSAMGGMTVISDGDRLYQSLSGMDFYVEKEAPESFAAFQASQLDEVPGMGAMLGEMQNQIPSVDALMSDDPYRDLTNKVDSVRYIHAETVDGVEAHKLEFTNELIDFTLWLKNEDAPLPLRVSANLGKMLEEISRTLPGGESLNAVLEISYKDWNLAAELSDADFAFTPPENARKAASFMEGLEEYMERATGQHSPQTHSLEGQSAPLFTAELLDGNTFDLQEYIGEKIIVLDFWATWCPPCRAAMPVMEAIAEEYHDELLILAVNQGEERSVIEEYLESADLDPIVALDEAMEIGDLYEVQGYPSFIVIDLDGVVHQVIVGFQEQAIRGALEDLTQGVGGKPAPDFSAQRFDGETFKLSDQVGEKIVVLDFWATWCGPCRAAMPRVESMVEEYKDRDVILIAVNQGEDAETIQKYLDEADVHPTILLDEERSIGQLFGVTGYPTFVIIDKEGNVRNTVLGYRESEIRETLTALTQ